MPINLNIWSEQLEKLVGTVLPGEVIISTKPEDFFDGFFCEAGFPLSPDVYPIWGDTGVIVYIDSAQTFVFGLDGGRWEKFCDTPCQRIFWISEEGVLGEVDDGSGKVTEFFPVSSSNAAAEYIALMCGKQLERGGRPNEREVPVEEIVADSFVRFFRYPDDLSPQLEDMPWVSTSKLSGLIKQYVAKSVGWLNPFMAEFHRLELRDKIKAEPESAKTIKLGDSDEKISTNEFILMLGGQNQSEADALRQLCFDKAASLTDTDILDPNEAWRLQAYKFGYCFMGPWADYTIDIAVLPAKEVFPDFLTKLVNPAVWQAIRDQVVVPLAKDVPPPAIAPLRLPSFPEQKRCAFEALAYRHAIDISSRYLSRFQMGKESANELHGLLANRYLEVAAILKRMPTYDTELERARLPLPYFIEAPLIAWERSPDNLKIQNGFMAFGNLLKQVVLLGLIEAHTVKDKLDDFKPLPKDLMAGISANPSLGHWSKCLDWLGRYAGRLQIFGGWIRVMVEHRAQTIQLNELRNKYAHPTSVLERAFIENINNQLESYFAGVVRKLRREPIVKIILPLSRRAVRRESVITFEFVGHDLCSPYDRFREARLELSKDESARVIEGEIFAVSSGDSSHLLALPAFFRAKEMSPDQYAILLYDKSFNGKVGIFSAVDSEVQVEMPMVKSPLDPVSWETVKPA